MTTQRIVRLAFLVASLTLGATACDDDTHRGPMEQAGHDVDHAAQRAQHDVHQAGHDVAHDVRHATN